MKTFTFFRNVLMSAILLLVASCGSDDPASEMEGSSQSDFIYTIGNQSWTDSRYWKSELAYLETPFTHHNQRVYWEMDILGAIDDAVDGNFLQFYIFSQNVSKGFEFTRDNFCVPFRLLGDVNAELRDFKKKSGSAKITEMNEESAKVVFQNFIMEAEGSSYDITINGTVSLDVDDD